MVIGYSDSASAVLGVQVCLYLYYTWLVSTSYQILIIWGTSILMRLFEIFIFADIYWKRMQNIFILFLLKKYQHYAGCGIRSWLSSGFETFPASASDTTLLCCESTLALRTLLTQIIEKSWKFWDFFQL